MNDLEAAGLARIFCQEGHGGVYMNKSLLRSTLKNFRALPLDKANHANVMIAPQEMLDFLALRAGIKPVFLLGRGFDDLKWIEGAVAMARKAGLHEVEGPIWNAKADDEALPRWFRDHLKAVRPASQAFYICRTRSTAERSRSPSRIHRLPWNKRRSFWAIRFAASEHTTTVPAYSIAPSIKCWNGLRMEMWKRCSAFCARMPKSKRRHRKSKQPSKKARR